MRGGIWAEEGGLEELVADMSEDVVGAHKCAGSWRLLVVRERAVRKTLQEEGSGVGEQEEQVLEEGSS